MPDIGERRTGDDRSGIVKLEARIEVRQAHVLGLERGVLLHGGCGAAARRERAIREVCAVEREGAYMDRAVAQD